MYQAFKHTSNLKSVVLYGFCLVWDILPKNEKFKKRVTTKLGSHDESLCSVYALARISNSRVRLVENTVFGLAVTNLKRILKTSLDSSWPRGDSQFHLS